LNVSNVGRNLHLESGVISEYDASWNNSLALALVQEFEVATMVQVPIRQWAGIAIYLLAITVISLLGTKLSSVARAAQPLPEGARRPVTALEAPSMTSNILAARLDLAEKEDLIESASFTYVASAADGSLEPSSHPSSITARVYSYELTTGSAERPKFRNVRSSSRYAASARDVFNRSFGVISVAANY
jgi:hypothetical protein